MSDTRASKGRSRAAKKKGTVGEQHWRSQLAEILADKPFVRGSLQIRHRKCGKPTCHCVKGKKHRSAYLVFSEAGKYRQVYIPADREAEVRQWVKNYHELRRLIEKRSQSCCGSLRIRS